MLVSCNEFFVSCNWFLCDFGVHLLNFVNLNSLLLVLLGLDDDKEWFSLGGSLFLTILGQVYICFLVKLLSIIILRFVIICWNRLLGVCNFILSWDSLILTVLGHVYFCLFLFCFVLFFFVFVFFFLFFVLFIYLFIFCEATNLLSIFWKRGVYFFFFEMLSIML